MKLDFSFKNVLAISFVGIFLAQAIYLAAMNSGIADETAHIVSGYSYLKSGTHELNQEHPPLVKKLAAIPLMFMDLKSPVQNNQWERAKEWQHGWDFLYGIGNPAESILLNSRLALLPLAILMAFFIFVWTRELFGEKAALGSLFIFAFFPEMIAHALLVTYDFSAALFYYAAFYFSCRFYLYFQRKDIWLAGFMAALGILSKYSLVLIFPLMFLLALGMAWERRPQKDFFHFPLLFLLLATFMVIFDRTPALIFAGPLLFFWIYRFKPEWPVVRNPQIRFAAGMILLVLAITFALVAIFYFEPHFWFDKFRPFRRFLRGWQIFRGHAEGGGHPGYLFGSFSETGWWYYYFAAMTVKIPLPILLLSFFGCGTALIDFFRQKNKALLIFFAPPLLFLFVASFLNHTNIGVRHVLPVYPFLISLGGYGLSKLLQGKRQIAAGAISIWLVWGTLSQFPNYLSYFNELARIWGGKENILGDSNISWGQDLRRLKDYIRQEKISKLTVLINFHTPQEIAYYQIPAAYDSQDFKFQKPGIYALDIFSYQGLLMTPGYEWLRNRKPDEKIGGSIWIYKF